MRQIESTEIKILAFLVTTRTSRIFHMILGRVSTCLLADIANRLGLIPDSSSHFVTASVVDCSGAKKSITSSRVICLP
jgi:hypothetical protein